MARAVFHDRQGDAATMDLSYSAQDEAFRTELRAWLDESVPAEWRAPGFWLGLSADESFARRRDWEASKAAAGFSGIEWPVEFGGRGGTPAQKAIHDEELALASAPITVNTLGLTFLAPTVMSIGTDAQKKEIIGPLLRNEVIWCQGFSEPDAGSDLAAVRTRGVLDESTNEYVINGQKIWTSNALYADKMFGLIRTHPGDKKHRGLSMLLIDLRSPGVEIRPLKQMSGALDFGEVFFTDVRVPADSVLGPAGEGWKVAMLLLSFERGSSAMAQYTGFRRELDAVIALARRTERAGRPAIEDPKIRQTIAQLHIELEGLRLHSLYVLSQVERGRPLGAASSLTKLQWSSTHQAIGDLFTEVAGVDHQLTGGSAEGVDPTLTSLQRSFLWSRSETIWGGSSEIQRGIVSEQLLGLPR
jgi:alkylation response protein AidB-like acyl-CoA dehydrogenase